MLIFVALALTSLPVTTNCQLLVANFKDNSSQPDNPDVVKVRVYAHSAVALPIVTVGITGNLLSLWVLSRPNLKGVMYIYLRGLAVSNLCVLIAAVPALRDISHGLPGGHYFTAIYQAHFKIPLINAFMSSSVYIIMCMTVNRFCSMWKPDLFRRYHTWTTAVISISLCFVFSLLLHVPLCLQTYIILSEILLRFGPILVLAVLNPLIIVKFREVSRRKSMLKGGGNNTISLTSDNFTASMRVKPGTSIVEALVPVASIRRRAGSNAANGQTGNGVSSEERVLALVLVSVILLFVVCTTPAAILSLIYSVKLNHNLQFQWFRQEYTHI